VRLLSREQREPGVLSKPPKRRACMRPRPASSNR
jgi:hypothetical protein